MEIDRQFHQVSLRERLKILITGLRAPRESRAYKLARIEAQRLAAPALAVLLPLLLVAAIVLAASAPKPAVEERGFVSFNRTEKQPDTPARNEPLQPRPEEGKTENNPAPNRNPALPDITIPVVVMPNIEPVPGPVPHFHATVEIRPPVDNVQWTSPTGGPFGPGGDGNGGGGGPKPPAAAEDAVMRGLRWLKLNQNPDGSWSANKPAMTGLALLCFLAHGELPGNSPEFGDTVRRGIEFLVVSYNGRSFHGADGNEYAHPIAAYALCEAYGMTRNPALRGVAESAVRRIIDGQQPGGGWDYKMEHTGRADTSYMGWAAQCLRAAQLARLFASDPEWSAKLDRACKLSNNGFLLNGAPGGGFGYTGPGRGGLTAVGALCMRYHGAAKHRQAADSLKLVGEWKPGWGENPGLGGSVQYYYYYATQALFLAGGKTWENWNGAMVGAYEAAQKIQRGAIADANGVLRDAGWWENADQHSDRPVMDTCLVILQLEVYYRGDRGFMLGLEATHGLGRAADWKDPNDVSVQTGTL